MAALLAGSASISKNFVSLPICVSVSGKALDRRDDARRLDRQQFAERIGLAVGLDFRIRQRHEALAGQDHQRPAALGDVFLQTLPFRQRQLLDADIAEDDAIETRPGHRRQAATAGVAKPILCSSSGLRFWIEARLLEDDAFDLHGAIAFQSRGEIVIFPARLAVDQQHIRLVVGDADGRGSTVVVRRASPSYRD